MLRVKNYETMLKFVKRMSRILCTLSPDMVQLNLAKKSSQTKIEPK